MSLKNTLLFCSGAVLGLAGGFVAGYKLMDKKTKQEIEEIRDFYANRDTNTEAKIIYEEEVSDDEDYTEDTETGVEDEQNPVEYARKISNSYHTPYGGHGGGTDTDSSDTKERQIKVITEEEFEHHEFEKGSLTYYADHVLVDDDNGEVIDDIQSTVTYAALDQFNEEGMLYVENQFTYMVYEIQEDPRPYYAGEY